MVRGHWLDIELNISFSRAVDTTEATCALSPVLVNPRTFRGLMPLADWKLNVTRNALAITGRGTCAYLSVSLLMGAL